MHRRKKIRLRATQKQHRQKPDAASEKADAAAKITIDDVLGQRVTAPFESLNAYGKAYQDKVIAKDAAEKEVENTKAEAEKAKEDLETAKQLVDSAKAGVENAQKAYDRTVVTGMSVTNGKDEYQVGETFDASKINVEITHADGSKETLSKEQYTVTDAAIPAALTIEELSDLANGKKLSESAKVSYRGKDVDLSVNVKAHEYSIIKGANSSYQKGSAFTAQFVSDAEFDVFAEVVLVDGKEVSKDMYEAVKGSTDVTFTKAYIESLTPGRHSLSILSKDGYASTNFTVVNRPAPDVKPNAPYKAPKTGIEEGTISAYLMTLSLLALSCMIGIYDVSKLKRRIAK